MKTPDVCFFLKDYFLQGVRACKIGKAELDNPYFIHSDPWRSWLFGWLHQHRAAELEIEEYLKAQKN